MQDASYLRAILWAQVRTLLNFYPRHRGGTVLSLVISTIWYAGWAVVAGAIAMLLGEVHDVDRLSRLMSAGLLVVFLYWQVIPLVLATTGASLDLKRLLVYPIPRRQLFVVEVLLRITISLEMLLLLMGASVGLWRNPMVRFWAPFVFIPFVIFNLCLSAGLRDLLTRLLARRRVREVVVFMLVMLAALPQFIAVRSNPRDVRRAVEMKQSILLPWSAAGDLSAGHFTWLAAVVLMAWSVASYWFGRRQFDRGLRFDAEAARSEDRPAPEKAPLTRFLFAWPARLLPDPLAAMVEKELRFLGRAPRFRLLFLMGFTFGIIIWLPIVFRPTHGTGFFSDNMLMFVSAYALLLLGEALIWNVFGYDRSAAQFYHVAPVPFWKVMAAKNITATFFVVLEILLVTLVCFLLRFPLTPLKVLEAFTITLLFLLYLIAFGNMSSIYYPKGIDPAQSWRNSTRGSQMLLMFVYPLAAMPLTLPYLARYAFDSEWAFYAIVPVNVAFGALLYWFGMESALEGARTKRESMVACLSESEGPISANL